MKRKCEEIFQMIRLAWKLWPRRFVLRDSGTPVELLHVEETAEGRRMVVELPDGSRQTVPEEALNGRLAHVSLALAVIGGVALAGLLAGATLLPPLDEQLLALRAACTALQENGVSDR